MKWIYCLLFAALCAVPTYSMNWKQRLLSGLYKASKVLSVGFPIGVGVVKAGARVYFEDDLVENSEKTLRPAPPEVSSWSQKQLASCGEELAKTPIKIESRPGLSLFASDSFIGIPERYSKAIIKSDLSMNGMSKKNAFLPVSLRHEAAHVNYHDATSSTAVGTILGSTALVQLATSGIQFLRKTQLPPTTIRRGFFGLCMGGVSGIAKVYAAHKLESGYRCCQEYRADKFAYEHTDSVEELEDWANYLEDHHENVLALMVAKTAYSEGRDPELEWSNFKASPLWMQNIRSKVGFLAFDPKHPHPLKRAERARAAAEKLRQKNQQAAKI